MEIKSCAAESLPFMALIMTEFMKIGLTTLSKAAMAGGLSPYVYIVYYDALGTIILLPCFLFRYLSGRSLPISFTVLCRLFGLGFIGKCLFQTCFFTGLGYSSVTLGAAISNMSPIFTYLLAIGFGIEKPDLRKMGDQLKAMGTIVVVLGALIATLYKGPVLLSTQDTSNSSHTLFHEQQPNWPLGGLFLTLSILLLSLSCIFQADTAKLYPDEVSLVFFFSLLGTVQTAAVSSFLVKDPNSWRLRHKADVIAIIYAAFSMTAVTCVICTWCLRKKGPVFVSMFSPLGIVIAAFVGFAFLADDIYLGSVIGSVTTAVGFYAVMWGQAKSANAVAKNIDVLDFAAERVNPLLQSCHNRSVV